MPFSALRSSACCRFCKGTDSPISQGSPSEWEEEDSIDLQPKNGRPGMALSEEDYHDLIKSFKAKIPKMQFVDLDAGLLKALCELCAGLVSLFPVACASNYFFSPLLSQAVLHWIARTSCRTQHLEIKPFFLLFIRIKFILKRRKDTSRFSSWESFGSCEYEKFLSWCQ